MVAPLGDISMDFETKSGRSSASTEPLHTPRQSPFPNNTLKAIRFKPYKSNNLDPDALCYLHFLICKSENHHKENKNGLPQSLAVLKILLKELTEGTVPKSFMDWIQNDMKKSLSFLYKKLYISKNDGSDDSNLSRKSTYHRYLVNLYHTLQGVEFSNDGNDSDEEIPDFEILEEIYTVLDSVRSKPILSTKERANIRLKIKKIKKEWFIGNNIWDKIRKIKNRQPTTQEVETMISDYLRSDNLPEYFPEIRCDASDVLNILDQISRHLYYCTLHRYQEVEPMSLGNKISNKKFLNIIESNSTYDDMEFSTDDLKKSTSSVLAKNGFTKDGIMRPSTGPMKPFLKKIKFYATEEELESKTGLLDENISSNRTLKATGNNKWIVTYVQHQNNYKGGHENRFLMRLLYGLVNMGQCQHEKNGGTCDDKCFQGYHLKKHGNYHTQLSQEEVLCLIDLKARLLGDKYILSSTISNGKMRLHANVVSEPEETELWDNERNCCNDANFPQEIPSTGNKPETFWNLNLEKLVEEFNSINISRLEKIHRLKSLQPARKLLVQDVLSGKKSWIDNTDKLGFSSFRESISTVKNLFEGLLAQYLIINDKFVDSDIARFLMERLSTPHHANFLELVALLSLVKRSPIRKVFIKASKKVDESFTCIPNFLNEVEKHFGRIKSSSSFFNDASTFYEEFCLLDNNKDIMVLHKVFECIGFCHPDAITNGYYDGIVDGILVKNDRVSRNFWNDISVFMSVLYKEDEDTLALWREGIYYNPDLLFSKKIKKKKKSKKSKKKKKTKKSKKEKKKEREEKARRRLIEICRGKKTNLNPRKKKDVANMNDNPFYYSESESDEDFEQNSDLLEKMWNKGC